MTAVASPPSLQPLPRLGWNSGNGSEGGLNSMSAEDVTRIFLPKKGPQRTNSSSSISSLASTSSSTSLSTVSSSAPQSRSDSLKAQAEREGWIQQKKTRAFWPSSKAEAVSAISTARPQSLPTPLLNGQSASSVMSAIHQPSPMVPSQNMIQTSQQTNGGRAASIPTGTDPPALLVLLPLNGTFERKQITVPLFPDVLRIGRQTNAKTIPTPLNGYFDSKVLSRQHAEVWADRTGKVWIRDVKSSNGTFVNGQRLSPENRDSEPHELRETDTLELGIDIVSEDQKSIVHHKVSAKVEHAGIHSNTASVLDLNFGDIDPGSGGGLMGPPFPQHVQMRGRGTSQGSLASNGRMTGPQGANGNMNGLGMQRQMNAWLSPVTIEQVVKRLGSELKSAKYQAQDLHRTDDYMKALLSNDLVQPKPELSVEAPVPAPAPPAIPAHEPQTNGIPSPPKVDSISPFSQPPAPPPNQPLPEKPDSIRSIVSESSSPSSFKRIETEKPRSVAASPIKPDSYPSQILSLVEALTSAKREIDSQGIRVLHLEDLLRQERKARENAEERARQLLERSRGLNEDHKSNVEEDAFNPPSESSSSTSGIQTNGFNDEYEGDDPRGGSSPSTNSPTSHLTPDNSSSAQDTKDVEASTARLQARLDLMVRDMDEMKQQIENYKTRAETAENERSSLADMIQQIRSGNAEHKISENGLVRRKSFEMATQTDCSTPANGSIHHHGIQNGSATKSLSEANGKLIHSAKEMEDLQTALAVALSQRSLQNDTLVQSAPYASMLGVVLLGVGIMAYLNGWQKLER